MVHVNVYVKHQEVNLWLLYERSVKNRAGKNSSAAKVLEENQSYGLCVHSEMGTSEWKKSNSEIHKLVTVREKDTTQKRNIWPQRKGHTSRIKLSYPWRMLETIVMIYNLYKFELSTDLRLKFCRCSVDAMYSSVFIVQ